MDWTSLLNSLRSNDYKDPTPKVATDKKPVRSEFQRDYDRALFSTPVRRLQDKAQVFPLEPHDSVRTRLTHSLEVANVAQSITRQALEDLPGQNQPTLEQINDLVVIAGTCGLIHDLGNPPFGHAGEEAIISWFQQKINEKSSQNLNEEPVLLQALQKDGNDLSQDFLRFDGNPQTLRLLTRLTMLADYDGLSLTLSTLSASFKYIAQADEPKGDDHAREKPGFFFSERDLVRDIQRITSTGNARNPITFLVEAADDIVYSVVDLEDGIKKGAFNWTTLLDDFKKAGVDTESTGTAFKDAADNLQRRLDKQPELKLKMTLQEFSEANAQLFRTFMIRNHVAAVVKTFVRNYDKIMAGKYTDELLNDGDTREEWKVSKKIARARVFPNPSILRLELMGKQVIHDLMTLFWTGIKHAPYAADKRPAKEYLLLSPNYRQVFEHTVKQDSLTHAFPVEYRRLQLLADYLCGMTDTFAVDLHRELFNA